MLFLDELGCGHQVLRVGKDEVPRERAEVRPESSPEPLRPIRVALREHVEVFLERAANRLPVELHVWMLSLEEMAEPFRATLGLAPRGLERLGLGVQREQDPLLNLAGPGLPLPLHDRQLVAPATNVRHPRAPLCVRGYHAASMLCKAKTPDTTSPPGHKHLADWGGPCLVGLIRDSGPWITKICSASHRPAAESASRAHPKHACRPRRAHGGPVPREGFRRHPSPGAQRRPSPDHRHPAIPCEAAHRRPLPGRRAQRANQNTAAHTRAPQTRQPISAARPWETRPRRYQSIAAASLTSFSSSVGDRCRELGSSSGS